MKKKTLAVLLVIAFLLLCFTLVACDEGTSPVESIVVTNLPVTKYYVGDSFSLNDAQITVYYENGRVETVTIDPSMISFFDSNVVGDQILTIMYGGVATQIKVTVSRPPISSVRVADTDYKKEYVVGQSLDLNNVYINVTYTNNHVEKIAVTADMIERFDSSIPGERDVVVHYQGYTPDFTVTVVPRSISQIGIEIPNKTSYVVGERLNFDGSRIFLAYNNNTQNYVETNSLLNDENFKVYISDVETDLFTKSGAIVYVTVSYYGHTADFIVSVADVKATKLEWTKVTVGDEVIEKKLKDQPKNLATHDLSDAYITVSYNNGVIEDLPLTDDKVEIRWGDFNVSVSGKKYTIVIACGGLEMQYEVAVVEPVEKELIVFKPDVSYYQDGPEIDLTQWSYSILLTNGYYRLLGSEGVSRLYFTRKGDGSVDDYGLFAEEPDVSTSTFGTRTYKFRFVSTDLSITLEKEVTFTVHERVLTEIADLVPPTRNVYYPNDELDLEGGSFVPVYNDGMRGERVALTTDMPKDGINGYTASVGPVSVDLSYTDETYGGKVDFSYDILVVKRAEEIAYSENLSVGLKTTYILGETFDPTSLVVNVRYSDGSYVNFTEFRGEEWSFEGTTFNTVGAGYVTLYYGSRSGGSLSRFTRIPVVVTNDISDVDFIEGFTGFGTVVEGMEIAIPASAKLVVTRQNGDKSSIGIQKSMIDYRSSDSTLGTRDVGVSYEGFDLVTTVTVLARSISSVTITRLPAVRSYVKTDTVYDLTDLVLKVSYNNNTVLNVTGARLSYVGNDGDTLSYTATLSGRTLTVTMDALVVDFDQALLYNEQTVTVAVSDVDAIGGSKTCDFVVYCFEKLIKELTFGTNEGGDGATLYFDESEDFTFPADAYIKVTYRDDTFDKVPVSDSTNGLVVVDYDKNTAGMQSVTATYLLNECAISVNVRGKVLSDISVFPAAPEYVSLVEGVPLSADVLSVRLHFVRHNGEEYSPVYYSDVEFGNVKSCTYDENAEFLFDPATNYTYYEGTYSLTYEYNGVEKTASFIVRTYKKKAVSITMQVLPRSEYIEGEDTVSLYDKNGDPGKILVTYDNGKSIRYDLDNNLVSVSPRVFDGSEIEYGSAPRRQRITVTFHDGSNQISTEYYVTVKDREYLSVDYFRNPTDGIYTFRYGADASNRPGFHLEGYTMNAAGDLVLTTMATTQEGSALLIDNQPGFELYYLDENGVRLDEFPKNVGLYTVVIHYEGDAYNNVLYEDSRFVRILPKELTLTVVDKTVVYGDYYDALTVKAIDGEESVYRWTVSDDNGNVGAAALEYAGETVDGLADLTCLIYRGEAPYAFYTVNGSSRTVYAAVSAGTTVVGNYELRPSLLTQHSLNYTFKRMVSGVLTVQKKPIKIVAHDVEKTYGERDPRLNGYDVYDENDLLIGASGVINLDGGNYVDTVAGYTLYRRVDDEHEQVGAYAIEAGSSSNIANYDLDPNDYTQGTLTINKKAITIVGTQAKVRYYGHAAPETVYEYEQAVDDNGDPYQILRNVTYYYEYSFAIKAGSSLERGDRFEDVFDFLIDYRSGVSNDMLSVVLKQGVQVVGATDFDETADAGTYTVSVSILNGADNYSVTVEDFSFTVTPEPITVTLNSCSVDYLTYAKAYYDNQANWASMAYGVDRQTFLSEETPYQIAFSDGFVLDESYYPVFRVVKQNGLDAGRYALQITPESIAAFADYDVTVVGDYAQFVQNDLHDSGYASFIRTIPAADRTASYLVIKPHRFDFVRATSEEYGRKAAVRPALTIDYGFELGDGSFYDYVMAEQANLLAAFSFTLTNTTDSRANFGYYTADVYTGSMDYNYFYNVAGRNYYPSLDGSDENGDPVKTDLSFDSMLAIYNYVYLGVQPAQQRALLTESFRYEITPVELDIIVQNGDCSYTGETVEINKRDYPVAIDIELAPYSLCAGDSLSIGYDIQVRYYDGTDENDYLEEEFVEADMVYHSGRYRVYVTGIGNYNYVMSDSSTQSVETRATFTVRPISLDVYVTTADANGYVHKTYSGKAIRTAKMDWQAVNNGNDEIGYYTADNGTFRIVNNSGLVSAPKSLRIDAITYENGIGINPTNANALDGEGNVVSPYEYVCSVNEAFTDMSVRFVKPNPAFNGLNDRYINAEYGFVIDPKPVDLGNLTNGRVNFKDYDGREPAMANVDKILVNGDVSADRVDVNRLSFTFTRDMTHVPEELQSVITSSDMTSAGYFFVKASYTNSAGYSNYTFQLETEYYIIKRLQIPVTLNGTGYYLNKEFDTLAPSAVKSDVVGFSSVRDDVFIELVVHSYRANESDPWAAYDSTNNAGLYAYTFKTYAKVNGEDLIVNGNKVYYSDFIDETYGNKLLSWNYCYYLSVVSGVDTNGKDGVYYINPKTVSIYLPGASDNGENYVYPRTFDTQTVTAAQATEEMCGAYTIRDGSGATISEETLIALGFDSVNGTHLEGGVKVRDKAADIVASGSDITYAGYSFSVSFQSLAAKNPNFSITNREIKYSIVKLNVDIKLRYENGSGDAEMVYGTVIMKDGSGVNYKVFDFYDVDAFAAAIHRSTASVGSISSWLSEEEADYGNVEKFVFQSTTKYYLKDTLGSYNLADEAILDAGTYYAHLTGLYSNNYSFTIHGDSFTILQKPISITGASRNYFDKGASTVIDWSIDGNVRAAVENRFINAVLSYFEDGTPLNADAGSFESNGDYYVSARRSDVESVEMDYPNYCLDITEIFPANYESSKLYLKLTIKKLPLTVALRGTDGGTLRIKYGQVLSGGNYALVYTGLPTLVYSTEYDYTTEFNKQNAVKSQIENNILDIATLAGQLKSISVNNAAYTDYDLDDYLKGSTVLTNYEIIFDDFFFFVDPIVLRYRLQNRAGTLYDDYGRFSIIIDETDALTYSETGNDRLSYSFSILNPTDIIGYESGMTMEQMMGLVLSGGTAATYRSDVRYEITKSGSDIITAGECEIKLTDDWYRSVNYQFLISNDSPTIMVYPVIVHIGFDADNNLPYSAVSVFGAQGENYATEILRSLSMLVKFTYRGMEAGQEVQWVDTKKGPDADFYAGSDWAPSFTLSFAAEEGFEPTSLVDGDLVAMKLTYTESFYAGQRESTIESPEFLVRIYSQDDSLVRDKTSMDFVDQYGNRKDFSAIVSDAGTGTGYYATQAKGSTQRLCTDFDVVSTDFVLSNSLLTGSAFGLILHSGATDELTLWFENGGRDDEHDTGYGFSVVLHGLDGVQYSSEKIKTYTYIDKYGRQQTSDIREIINLFDGRRHTVVAYVDKVGCPDTSTNARIPIMSGSDLIGYTYNLYYTVTFEIDGKYVFKTKYLGGTVSYYFTVTTDPVTNKKTVEYNAVSYDPNVAFNNFSISDPSIAKQRVYAPMNGSVGFTVKNVSAQMLRLTLKKMGVSLSQSGRYVQDVRMNPSEADTVLYLEEGSDLNTLIDYFVVNSSDGYDANIAYKYYSAVNGNEVPFNAPGLYIVEATLKLDAAAVRTQTYYVCVVESTETPITLSGSVVQGGSAPVYGDTPLYLHSDTGGGAFSTLSDGPIAYSRLVFDYDGEVDSSTRIILKGSNNTRADLSSYNSNEIYTGVSVEINRSRCSDMYERTISGYNGTQVEIEYDDCNPFGVLAGDFGNIASLSVHTPEKEVPDSTVSDFDLLGTYFGNFFADKDNSLYTVFYSQAIDIFNEASYVAMTKNVSTIDTKNKSAAIGINYEYAWIGSEVNTSGIDVRTVIANLFGFSSKTDFIGYANALAAAYGDIDDGPLENGCFKTANNYYIFPMAVKNDLASTVLLLVLLDASGNVTVWVNDFDAALWATNFNVSYHTASTIHNELYCKTTLFATGVFQTKIHVRDGSTGNNYYWVSERYDIDWNGKKNVLTARFDQINGVIDIRLVRDGDLLMNEKIRTESMSSGVIGGLPISSANIKNIIGIGYVGVHMNMYASMTLYDLRMGDTQASEYSLIDGTTGAVVDENSTLSSHNSSYLISDAYGVATPFSYKSVRTTFSVSDYGSEGFMIMFNNNTPFFFGSAVNSQVTGNRGMILGVDDRGVFVSMYKYNIEYQRTYLRNSALSLNELHTIVVTVTDTQRNNAEDGWYLVTVYIDGVGYDAYAAAYYNDLHDVLTVDLNQTDPETGGVYNAFRDNYFLSDNHYVGLYNQDASITIKEVLVF